MSSYFDHVFCNIFRRSYIPLVGVGKWLVGAQRRPNLPGEFRNGRRCGDTKWSLRPRIRRKNSNAHYNIPIKYCVYFLIVLIREYCICIMFVQELTGLSSVDRSKENTKIYTESVVVNKTILF